jgi:signal transduction histidine kinase
VPSWARAARAPSVGPMSPQVQSPLQPGAPSRTTNIVVRVLTAPVSARTWRATIYAALSGVLGTLTFITFWVLTSVGIGMVFALLIGVLILWGALTLAHQLARLEGWRAQVYLERPLVVRQPDGSGTVPSRIWRRLSSGGSWLELLYGLLVLPLIGWVGYVFVVGSWGVALLFLAYPAYGWADIAQGAAQTWGLPFWPAVALHLVAGAYAAMIASWIAIGVAQGQYAVARIMLAASREEELTARVETLTESRAGLVDAVDAERRRIEGDLHDGAQQRLVAVAMTLGRAGQQFEHDPDNARRLVEEAHGETKAALVDLRNLARGIHPAVLTDRGLDAALSALAERCPVPCDVSVLVSPRPAATVEAVAYFVVSEALTNVAKHAKASRARISALRVEDRLIVEVVDNGVGGAHLEPGSGLSGLRDRARSVDGTLTLTSPPGGPTVLKVDLPCES